VSIFVIGDRNTVLGFSLVGVEGEAVESLDEARAKLDDALEKEGVEMVLLTEGWAQKMRARVDELVMNAVEPLVVEIPGSEMERAGPPLEEIVRQAVGIRLSLGGGG
jgi:V/A-type H+/Na+-transporting ATPase subunit F